MADLDRMWFPDPAQCLPEITASGQLVWLEACAPSPPAGGAESVPAGRERQHTMPNSLVAAFVDGLRQTVPFHSLPVTNRPTEELFEAHNTCLLQLRLPLYYDRLRKPRPREKTFDAAIQSGLAILSSFAATVGTHQAIVRIERGAPEAISFQPRPFSGANWVRPHSISPVAIQADLTDPLLEIDPIDARSTLTMPVSTRDVLHLAGKVATVLALQAEHRTLPSGTATFIFTKDGATPTGRVVYRSLLNLPARTVELGST